MDSTSATIVQAVLSSSPNHRGVKDVQVSEFSGGGVRITGLKQVSGTALCTVAKELDKLITVTPRHGTELTLEIEDVPGEAGPKPILSLANPTLTSSSQSTATSVHPLPLRLTTLSLEPYIHDHSAVEVFIRPQTITVIAVLPSKIKGGLAECIRNGRHKRKSTGSGDMRRSRPLKNVMRRTSP